MRPGYADPPRCTDIPEKHSRCTRTELPDGTTGAFRHEPMGNGSLYGVSFVHAHAGSQVELSIHPDTDAGKNAPLTVEELTDAAGDARLLTALQQAVGSPLFTEEGGSDG